VLPPIVKEQRLCATFSLVVAGADADRIDMARVTLVLRVDSWIAVCLSDVEERRIRAFVRLASLSMLIDPTTEVLIVWTGSRW
jgi:hypothetical protein